MTIFAAGLLEFTGKYVLSHLFMCVALSKSLLTFWMKVLSNSLVSVLMVKGFLEQKDTLVI